MNKYLGEESLRQKRMQTHDDLVHDLVPVIRELVKDNLSDNFVKHCVRIGDINPITGGLKSEFVGHMRVDLNFIIKTDTEELKLHNKMIDLFRNEKIFPEVLKLKDNQDGTYLIVMEELMKYRSFLSFVYDSKTHKSELVKLVKKAIEKISVIHSCDKKLSSKFDKKSDPYSERIRTKIIEIIAADNELSRLLKQPGEINGRPYPPLKELINNKLDWLKEDLRNVEMNLVHGDCHLQNIMFRRRGSGYSCQLIDPNPTLGRTDILYDYGKLLHWMDNIGWIKYNGKKCKTDFKMTSKSWSLKFEVTKEPKKILNNREFLIKNINEHLNKMNNKLGGDWEKRLKISLASAHLGMAAILKASTQINERRFVFGRAMELMNDL